MVYRCETFRNHKGIIVLQSLKVSHLSIIATRFYETLKLKNRMCELCTFSQIRSYILIGKPGGVANTPALAGQSAPASGRSLGDLLKFAKISP